ncbi:Uncharacterised protein [Serratia rubidaea]|nr:conserved protein of unknown function [Serratia sp. Tan611]SQJ17807.1 Uncharacterised protein [Serratia rubidaea]
MPNAYCFHLIDFMMKFYDFIVCFLFVLVCFSFLIHLVGCGVVPGDCAGKQFSTRG